MLFCFASLTQSGPVQTPLRSWDWNRKSANFPLRTRVPWRGHCRCRRRSSRPSQGCTGDRPVGCVFVIYGIIEWNDIIMVAMRVWFKSWCDCRLCPYHVRQITYICMHPYIYIYWWILLPSLPTPNDWPPYLRWRYVVCCRDFVDGVVLKWTA